MRIILILLILYSVFPSLCEAQQNPRIDKKELVNNNVGNNKKGILNHLKKGDSFYKKGIYDRAYRHYLYLHDNVNSDLSQLNYKLAVSALNSNIPADAVNYFYLCDHNIAKDFYLLLGKAHQHNLDYDAAKDAYNSYYNQLKRWPKRKFTERYQQLMGECEFGAVAVKDSLPYFVINLGPSVNSYFDEYAPVEYKQGQKLFFTTRRPEKFPEKPVNRIMFRERVLESNYIDGSASEASTLKRARGRQNISVAGISESENRVFYYTGKKRFGRIETARLKGEKVKRTKRLKGSVDKKSSKETTISISNSGDAYFVSNRRGGYGGKDIYFAKHKGGRRFRKAVNLGPMINTPFDEEAVYVTADGNTLYFSSNGHPGMGSFDNYRSEKLPDGSWAEPVNLGYPINSPGRDMFYFPTADSLVAFVASERPGGLGGLDIYKMKRDPRIPFSIWGEVTDVANGNILNGRVTVFDLNENSPIAMVDTDSLSGEYFIEMEDIGNFSIQADVAGYASVTHGIVLVSERLASVRQDFKLEKLLFPYTLTGSVKDKATAFPLQAEISFKSIDTDSITHRVFSDISSGFYSITFADKQNVTMIVKARDYFDLETPLYLKNVEGQSGEQNIELVRSRIDYVLTGVVTEENTQKPVPARFTVVKPGDEHPINISFADTLSGRYALTLNETGPYLLEITAEGYFFQNQSLQFHHDSTLIVRNIQMQPMSKGARIVVENILFTTGKATIRAESFGELNKLVRLLNENKGVRIEVSGHTDNVGSAAINKRLSRSRAQSVKNYLESQGIDENRIEFEGYGFDRPIAPNNTEDGRAANRRVEIEVIE
jgi:outer membrane protein OmpA-like peptidoglycan-associated protein